jgi:hypothetical protein
MPSASPAVLAAVYALLSGTLYEDLTDELLVCYGDPGNYQPDVIISLGALTTISTTPVMTPTRVREEASELTVTWSVFRAGDETQQVVALTLAYLYRDRFADYFKTKPNETLGGTCRNAIVTGDDYEPATAMSPGNGPGDPPVPMGRVATLTSKFYFVARV